MRLQVNSRHIYSKNRNKISKYTASFAIFLEKFLKKFSTISRIRELLKLSLKRIWPSRAERKLTLITRNSDPCGEDEWNGVDFLSTPRGMGKKEVAWSIAARSRLRVGEKREERHPPARNGATFPTAFGTCYCTTIKLFLLRHSWTFHGPLKRRYIYRFLVLETFRGYSPFWVKSLRGRRGRKGGTSGSPNVRVSRFFASFALCDPVETEPRGPWLGVDRVRGCVARGFTQLVGVEIRF